MSPQKSHTNRFAVSPAEEEFTIPYRVNHRTAPNTLPSAAHTTCPATHLNPHHLAKIPPPLPPRKTWQPPSSPTSPMPDYPMPDHTYNLLLLLPLLLRGFLGLAVLFDPLLSAAVLALGATIRVPSRRRRRPVKRFRHTSGILWQLSRFPDHTSSTAKASWAFPHCGIYCSSPMGTPHHTIRSKRLSDLLSQFRVLLRQLSQVLLFMRFLQVLIGGGIEFLHIATLLVSTLEIPFGRKHEGDCRRADCIW